MCGQVIKTWLLTIAPWSYLFFLICQYKVFYWLMISEKDQFCLKTRDVTKISLPDRSLSISWMYQTMVLWICWRWFFVNAFFSKKWPLNKFSSKVSLKKTTADLIWNSFVFKKAFLSKIFCSSSYKWFAGSFLHVNDSTYCVINQRSFQN